MEVYVHVWVGVGVYNTCRLQADAVNWELRKTWLPFIRYIFKN